MVVSKAASQQRAACEMPSDDEILEQISKARSEARDCAAYLGMDPQDVDDVISCPLKPGMPLDLDSSDEEDEPPATEGGGSTCPDPADLAVLRAAQDGEGYSAEAPDLSPQSSFALHTLRNGAKVVLRKSTICWLLSEGTDRLSSDRLQRVCAAMPTTRNGAGLDGVVVADVVRHESVRSGEWCVFRAAGRVRVGRVLGFRYMTGTGRSTSYSLPSAPVATPDGVTPRGLGCMCDWFLFDDDGRLTHAPDHKLILIECYLRTIASPKLVNRKLMMSAPVVAFINSL